MREGGGRARPISGRREYSDTGVLCGGGRDEIPVKIPEAVKPAVNAVLIAIG